MKKLILFLLLIPIFAKAQQPVPIDSSHYAARGIIITKIQGDSLASLMVRFSGSYSNPSWLNSIAWSKITSVPTIYSFTGSSSQYTKGDGTYGTLPSIPAATVLTKSANYTITTGDFGTAKVLYVPVSASGGNVTITMPTASSITGYIIIITKTDATANLVTISGLSADNSMSVQNSSKEIISDGTTIRQE